MVIPTEAIKTWAEIVGVGVAALSLAVTARETRMNTRVSRATFWLDLRKMFAEHNEVHLKLRGGGEWAQPGAGPEAPEDWAKVEAYMGLFEHCNRMLAQGLIDWNTFVRIYAYRLRNIARNERIADVKLRRYRADWTEFLELLERLGERVPPKTGVA
jgi:hypothetical protein